MRRLREWLGAGVSLLFRGPGKKWNVAARFSSGGWR